MNNADSNDNHSELENVTLATPELDRSSNSIIIRYLPLFLRHRIYNRPRLQAAIGNTGWLFSDKILRMGGGLIVGVLVARYLGPNGFGLLNYAIAFVSLFGALATLGLDSIVIRELVRLPRDKDTILGSAFVLRLGAALTTFIVVIVAISILRHGESLVIWVVGLSGAALIFQSLNVIDLLFQSRIQSKYTVYATNSAFVVAALVKVGLVRAGAPLLAFASAALGEAVLSSIFLLIAYRTVHLKIWDWRPKLHVMRTLLRDSWPLIFSGISIMISMRVDQVLIGQMLNDRQVGIYSAATRIAEVWYFVPWGIASSVFPLLVESKKQCEQLYYQRLQQYYDVLAILSISFSLFITLFASQLVMLLYGRAYLDSVGILKILIWSGVPMSIGAPWTNWMLLENKTKTMFHFQLFGASLNLILNLLFIPHFGIAGSAYATLISYGAWIVVLCPIMKSQRKAFVMMMKAIFQVGLISRLCGRRALN